MDHNGHAHTQPAQKEGERAQGEDWQDLDEPLDVLASLRNARAAPPELARDIEDKIRQRSGGRFFGPKTLADYQVFAIFALVILVGAGLAFWLLKDSSTGAIPSNGLSKPRLAPGAENAASPPP